MRALLIGSHAYRPRAECGDIDILCDLEWKQAWDEVYRKPGQPLQDGAWKYENCQGIVELTIPPPGSAHDLLLRHVPPTWEIYLHPEDEWIPPWLTLRVAPLTVLMALKRAHLILPSSSPAKWRRQMEEYCEIKRRYAGGSWDPGPVAMEVFTLHRKECLARAKKHPKLNQNKAGFFGNEPYEVFDHDSIHVALAYPLAPAYLQTKGEGAEVMFDLGKWNALPESEKLRCVIEESGILALERSILPALFLDRPYRGARWAYDYALMKVCTTITSGPFRDYAIDHWDVAMKGMPDLAAKFFAGVKSGLVRRKESVEPAAS